MKHLYMEQDYSKQYSKSQHSYLPIALFLTMVCAFFLLDAVLPLQDLMFPDALLTHLGKWPLSPAHVLFPRFPVVQMRIDKHVPAVIMLARSWKETGLLFGVFLGLFGLYLLALRLLPQTITYSYLHCCWALYVCLSQLLPQATCFHILPMHVWG